MSGESALDAASVGLDAPELLLFGTGVARWADIDGDGAVDLALIGTCAGLTAGRSPADRAGAVVVCSGRDAHVLRTLRGAGGSRFGASVSVFDSDLDGDGCAELAVGAPGESRAPGSGRVFVVASHGETRLRELAARADEIDFGSHVVALARSGREPALLVRSIAVDGAERFTSLETATGDRIATVELEAGLDRLSTRPRRASNVGDVDSDGTDDFAIALAGRLRVFSGATCARIHDVERPWFSERDTLFGDVACPVGDRDGDGTSDFVIGESSRAYTGVLLLVSGRDGRIVAEIAAPAGLSLLGFELALGWDADGDGTRDVIATHPSRMDIDGVSILSLEQGRVLFTIRGDWNGETPPLGWSVAIASDVDVDGSPELALTRFTDRARGAYGQGLVLLSGATGRMIARCVRATDLY